MIAPPGLRPAIAATRWAVVLATGLPAVVHGQVRAIVEGEAVVQVQGNVVVLQGGGAAPMVGPPVAPDPWWGDRDEATGPAEGPPAAQPPPQARLAEARRARAQAALARELSLVREACPGLDPKQRAAVLEVARTMVDQQAAGRLPLAGGMDTALTQAVERAAGPEEAAAHAAELAARAARRRAAAIAVIVEVVDRDELLVAAERQAVAAALAERWRPEWESVAATAARQRVTFARLPAGIAETIETAVDAETMAAWRARAAEGPR